MGIVIAAMCAALAVLVIEPSPDTSLRRLRRHVRDAPESMPRSTRPIPSAASRHAGRPWLLSGACAVAIAVALGGLAGVVAGAGVMLLAMRSLRRHAATAGASGQRQLAAVVPLTADLLAACLTAGAQPAAAADAVAAAVGGAMGEELRRVTATLRLGGDPEPTWLSLAGNDALAPLARAFARAAGSGASLAAILADVAEDARRQQRVAAEIAARRVGVYAAAPLGLCFLPAFVLLAIVPIIAGLVGAIPLH